eukprot:CAMPEP_0170470584 /NCGR_PEP_ID=MMETSP0123-20130129/13003_1 /TAXON_ID=182087 /ORGANISM="Favella ehrenbergii, Strain Fehren 1" /LENGTH=75 /DNA_ID=CAMNT_0010737777 /DNA_START=279 /DNA_END=506 /DNA_ORIENTATION=-
MLITDNVLEKLSVQISLKDLNLKDKLTCVGNIRDALHEMSSRWYEDSIGYAIVILDFCQSDLMIKAAIEELRQGI